jgi:hypothetical protein
MSEEKQYIELSEGMFVRWNGKCFSVEEILELEEPVSDYDLQGETCVRLYLAPDGWEPRFAVEESTGTDSDGDDEIRFTIMDHRKPTDEVFHALKKAEEDCITAVRLEAIKRCRQLNGVRQESRG